MTKSFCFSNDQIVSSHLATLHPLDIGLIRGYAIFDFFRVENSRPLFLEAYLQRFIGSAQSSHLPLGYDMEGLKTIIYDLIKKNAVEQGGIRMLLTGGISENNFSPTKGKLFVFCEDLKMPSPEKYETGVKLISEEFVRPLPSIKTTNYTLPVWLSARWKEQAAEDVVYHFGDAVSESSRSNIFMVKKGQLVTPKRNILMGITRKNVMALAGQVQERDISLTELLNADEVFITSTTKRILPVTQIDGTLIKAGRPGSVTRELMEKLLLLEQKEKTSGS